MSDKQWVEILLSELKTVRIVCKHRVGNGGEPLVCGVVVEIPIEKLAAVRKCPLCENYLRPLADPAGDPFLQLASALKVLQQLGGAEISFMLSSKVE